MKEHKLTEKGSYHGKPKGYNFDGPTNLGGANLWMAKAKTGDTGNQFAKKLPKPPAKGKKLKT